MFTEQPVCSREVPCKCCSRTASLFGVVDFTKNCQAEHGLSLPLSGQPVYYHRCPGCSFLFTTAFDHFAPADLVRVIYNDEYRLVDPDYAEVRPLANARLVADYLIGRYPRRVLDYGGGSGLFAERLRALGLPAVETYDPLTERFSARPSGRYDWIVCFEVVEHSPRPVETFAEVAGLLADPGIVLFSTLLQPADVDRRGVGWWYLAPRNGHVSLYTEASLRAVLDPIGLHLWSLGPVYHLAYRVLPENVKLPR